MGLIVAFVILGVLINEIHDEWGVPCTARNSYTSLD